jgi:lipopolysaccharide export system permease protein
MNHQHTQANHIFVARTTEEKGQKQWDVLWADKAYVTKDKQSGEEYLVLKQGKKYLGAPGKADYQIATFDRYQARLPHPIVTVKNDIRTERFANLWPFNNPDRTKAAELQWRISIPIMVFTLTLVGVPLSRVNPRAGKYAKLLPAIVLCVIYCNFLFISRNWIADGKIPIWLGVWWLHALVASFGGWLIWRNKGV